MTKDELKYAYPRKFCSYIIVKKLECGLCYALFVEVETEDVAKEVMRKVESLMGRELFFVL